MTRASMKYELPVFILGLDAADNLLIEEWAAAGELPTFSRLLERRAYGILESSAAVFSGSAWISIASGCNPAKCGVYSRYQLASGTYDVRRIKADDNRIAPFWNDFSGPVVIVDVPKVPLMPGIHGIQLVEWGAYDHYSSFSSVPTDLSTKVIREFGSHPFLAHDFEVALHSRRDFESLKDLLIAGVEMKRNLNLALLKMSRPQLFLSVFGETHAAGHAFWRFHDPRHPGHETNGPMNRALLSVYRAVDDAIGSLWDELPGDSTFVVLSSQGFCMDSMAGEDFVCELLIRMGMSVPRQTKTPYAAYVPGMALDMAHSRAFALPTDLQGYIRINLRGREPNGVVPQVAYDSVCSEIERELRALRHAEQGTPVVKEVVRVRDCFQGAYTDDLPDLSVIWHTEHVVTAVESPRCGLIRCKPDLTAGGGNHRGPGFMAICGPNVGSGRFVGHVFDVSPTICGLLGESQRAEWDGQTLRIPGGQMQRW